MNQQTIHEDITETLELCLSKMSSKLKESFDPEDKNSIKLLQQFRSTISLFRTWIKQTGMAISDTVNKTKENIAKTIKNTGQTIKEDVINKTVETFMKNKPQKPSQNPFDIPSGLLYTPT